MSIESETYRSHSTATVVLFVCGLVAAAAAGGAFWWDGNVSEWFQESNLPGDVRRMVSLSEAFAHGTGAAVILLAVYLACGTAKRPVVAVAIAITIASGVSANVAKMAFVRVRPHAAGHIRVVEHNHETKQRAGAEETEQGAVETEQGAEETAQSTQTQPQSGSSSLESEASESQAEIGVATPTQQTPIQPTPEIEMVEADFWDSRQRSFPSGHSATAWGLAIGLCLAFPRASGVLVFVATLASIQRISSGAHYPSDVLAGAAIACFWATVILWCTRLWRSSLYEST